jgi:hypothetical protein
LSSLERGVDLVRDAGMYDDPLPSSIGLHREFWNWREAFPGEPFWVHFQTIDVHGPGWFRQSPRFSGLYLDPGGRAEYVEWRDRVGFWGALDRFDETGVDPLEFYDRTQRLYSEAMAQQDHEIGVLVERLKSSGASDNTLIVIAADHGEHESGLVMLEPFPPLGQHTHLRPEHTRVPMIFVWPGRIPGGQRITQLVSMIDLLPTVLDLAGLPQPDVRQGQSLAPLMLGTEGWEARPVILDEFYVDAITGVRRGWIEVVDGRWGASLEINPHIEFTWRTRGEYVTAQRGERPGPLLLYDLWNDPHALRSVHEERPDLVDKYTAFLEAQWEAHQSLALLFSRPQEGPGLTTEQLETLRTLGYIRCDGIDVGTEGRVRLT